MKEERKEKKLGKEREGRNVKKNVERKRKACKKDGEKGGIKRLRKEAMKDCV